LAQKRTKFAKGQPQLQDRWDRVYAPAVPRRVRDMTFEEYVLARGAGLVRFARLLTGDDHRAEDLAQDVLAKAYVS
jgi:hypothetical protein